LYTFPSSGTYQVRVCADNNASFVGTIAESDENNNCGPWTNVTVNSGGGMTCSLSVNPTTVYINGSDTWTWTAISNPPGYVTKAYGTKDGVVDINGGNNFGTTNSTVVSGPAGVGAQSVRTRWFTISDPVTNALLCTSNQATVTIKTVSSSSFSLTVDKTIGGSVKSSDNGISCGTTCSNNYVSGSTVTLTAYPDSTNWKFAGWSGSCSGLGNCSLIINGPKTVKALFVPVPSDYREF
jgi:hypothetical protein